MNIILPETVAGFARPICPHCDKEYDLEIVDKGPIKCSECDRWFKVASKTIYQSREILE